MKDVRKTPHLGEFHPLLEIEKHKLSEKDYYGLNSDLNKIS
jgi:hypothetical protein